VRHGIALAQAGALQLVLDGVERETGESDALELLFCGGGGEVLQSLVSRGGEYLPDLVFEGLDVMWGQSSAEVGKI
ncbi:MAG: hypothetical protein ABJK20_14085, partial [Halieaceae bacterium]